jgi:hypothetical protein
LPSGYAFIALLFFYYFIFEGLEGTYSLMLPAIISYEAIIFLAYATTSFNLLISFFNISKLPLDFH